MGDEKTAAPVIKFKNPLEDIENKVPLNQDLTPVDNLALIEVKEPKLPLRPSQSIQDITI